MRTRRPLERCRTGLVVWGGLGSPALAPAALVFALLMSDAALAAPASGVPVDSLGFEPLTVGGLETQAGWLKSGAGESAANVQRGVVNTGLQALQVDYASNSDRRWAVPNQTGLPSARYVHVSWDMRVTDSTDAQNVFGPFFGSEAYDDTDGFKVVGSLGVDAATGEILYQAAGSGVLVDTGRQAAFDQWNHFDLIFDFDTHTYRGYYNGSAPLFTSGFVDRRNNGSPLSSLTDADISALAAAGDAASKSTSGTSYFDNFRVLDVRAADFDVDLDVDQVDLATWERVFGGTPSRDGDATRDGRSAGEDFLIWQIQQGSNLAVVAPLLTADFDVDSDVDQADFSAWEIAFATNANADANGDGTSGGEDFIAWQRELGRSAPNASHAARVVPEPSSLVLWLCAAMAIGARAALHNEPVNAGERRG